MKKNIMILQLICLTLISMGQETFIKTFGGDEGDFGYSSIFDGDSIIYTYGNSYSYSINGNPAYLIKCNSSGDTILTKVFPYQSYNKHGYKILRHNDTCLVLAGYIDGGVGIYLHMINNQTDTIWHKTYKAGLNTSFYDLNKTNDNGYILVGHLWGPPSYGILLKVNEFGDSLWLKQYDNLGFTSINKTKGGDIIFAGRVTVDDGASGKYGLIKANINGDTLWTKSYYSENNTRVKYAFETFDNSFILAGGFYVPSSNSTGFLVKTNQNGDTLWTKTYHEGEIDDYIMKVIENKDSTITFISNIVTDNGQSTYIRLTKLNSFGDTIWNRDFKNFGCHANDLIHTSDSGFLITGYYRDNPESNNSDDVLLIRTDKDGMVISENPNTISFISNSMDKVLFYPNPSSTNLTFMQEARYIQIFDISGKIQLNTTKKQVQLDSFSKGIYFVVVQTDSGEILTDKLIVE